MNDQLPDQLLCVLRSHTGVETLEYDGPPEPLHGGFWAELLAFSLADPPDGWAGELVARVMPEPLLGRKETVVQAAVAGAGVPTPRVRGAGGPDDGLGRAFMVMDRAAGAPLLGGLHSVGALLGAPRRLWRMPDVLADVMARLHTVDPDAVRGELATVTGVATTVPAMLDGLHAWVAGLDRTDLTGAAAWLIDHPAPVEDAVICHGDLHPFNVLVDGGGRATVLDWSASLLGPRAYDVAFTSMMLESPPVAVPTAARAAVRAAGRGLAARFVRRYERYSNTRVEPATLRWYQAVVCLRALAEVAGWVHEDVIDGRAGHPWLVSGPALVARLGSVTGVTVQPR